MGSDRMKKYHPKVLGFEASLKTVRQPTADNGHYLHVEVRVSDNERSELVGAIY